MGDERVAPQANEFFWMHYKHQQLQRGKPMSVDPISLEVFKNMFESVAEEMGVALQRTAYSPNIKERRDFSCAVFDPHGNMVAQAADIPVHLGAMPASVKAALEVFPDSLNPGDIVMLNDPYMGGSHLPDITMVAPIYALRDLSLIHI